MNTDVPRPGHLESGLRLTDPDDFYQELLDLHRDLSDEQSALLNAKLVLLLANHIGDAVILREAMQAAREDLTAAGPR